ncbi:hypothetical protein U875_25335 [Pandoraea pnomenusa 3kgm]|nr:hypothetical protein U875_25335 [Pandoraea pnomenusa 3kgm]ALU64285.1 hypothetical protein DA70_24475 [Pandoraea pnomenusa]
MDECLAYCRDYTRGLSVSPTRRAAVQRVTMHFDIAATGRFHRRVQGEFGRSSSIAMPQAACRAIGFPGCGGTGAAG